MIRRVLRALALLRSVQVTEDAVEWSPADADALRAFLRGVVGRKLVANLRHACFADTYGAVGAPPERLAWRCGHAAGMQTLAAHIDLLSRETVQQAPPQGPTDDLTWLHGNQNEH